ncbi:helix-turn-helix domain-containing protein [Stutzerimonas urumqiensis]|uniref:helix-turn-helix domain-containing protein n=1 Tax=Stutzerimonas urumqiensis TaxID=638269 RepID=UPI003DA52104
MSFQAMAWATEQKLPTREKFVLIMLANYASNDAWDCHPSLNTLAEDTGMSRDTVMRAIKTLESDGMLRVIRRNVDGINLPNVYRLIRSAGSSRTVQGVVAECGEGGSTQQGGVVAECDSNLSLEPINEPVTEQAAPVPAAPAAKVSTSCPAQAIADLFNQILTPTLPAVVILNSDRKAKLKSRWTDSPVHQSLDFWRDYFETVSSSDFLMGRAPGKNGGKPFRASFDWLICSANFVKVVEGNYHA